MPNTRDNDAWLRDLRAGGEQRQAALADLRALIRRDRPRGLSRWVSPEDPEFEFFQEYTVQSTLSHILEELDAFEGHTPFLTWAYKIAVRIDLTEIRRRRWKDISLEENDENPKGETGPNRPAPPTAASASVSANSEALQRLQQILIEELTEQQRAALYAIYLRSIPVQEVARRMGASRNGLYDLLHDARLRMKHRLEHEGWDPDELQGTIL